MSRRVETQTGEYIEFSDTAGSHGQQEIQVGKYYFDPTEYHIHVLKFLSGAKFIELGSIRISIPEDTDGIVDFGHIKFPYREYVSGVVWSLNQLGSYPEERRVPQYESIYAFALDALEEKLHQQVPPYSEIMYELALKDEKSHKQDGGIHSLRGKQHLSLREI